MAKKFETAIVISGDGNGGVRAVRANREELDRYAKSVDTGSKRTQAFARDVSSTTRELDFLKSSAKGVAAAVVGAFAIGNLRGQAKMIADTNALAQTLEVSTGTLQAWQYAGQQVGLEADKMGDIFKDVSDKVGDFAATGGGEAADLFENLNLNVKELQRLSPDQQILKIAEAVNQLEDPSQRTFYFESLADEMSRLGPLLANGAVGLRQQMQAARELGVAMDDVDVTKAVAANQAIIQLGGAVEGVSNQLVADLGPGLADAASVLVSFVREAGGADEVLGNVADVVTGLAALYAGKFAKGIGEATVKTLANIKANVAQTQATANANAAEAGRVAVLARTAAAEKTAEANSAALAAQRTAAARQEVAAEVQRIQSLQASLAAERALAAQRLQTQATAVGRVQVQARIVQLQTAETAAANQLAAANARLTEAQLADTAATRAATAAKVAQGKANATATAAVGQYTAAARVATVASGAMATAGRAAAGAMALVGGPAGVAILAAGALITYHDELDKMLAPTQRAEKAISDLTDEIDRNSRSALQNAIAQYQTDLVDLETKAKSARAEIERINNANNTPGPFRNSMVMGEGAAARREQFEVLNELGVQIQARHDGIADLQQSLNGLRASAADGGIGGGGNNLKPLLNAYDADHTKRQQLIADRKTLTDALDKEPEKAEAIRRAIAEIDDQLKKLNGTQKQTQSEAQKAAEQLQQRYESTRASMAQQIALMGQVGQAAQVRYDTEFGELRKLSDERKKALIDQAAELDMLQRKQDLLDSFVQSSSLSGLFDQRDQAQQIGGATGRIAERNVGKAITDQARDGMPNVTGLDAQYSGPFGEANRIEQERAQLQAWYAERIAMYQDFKETEADKADEYGAVIADLERQRATQLQQIDMQTQQARLAGWSSMFGDLAGLTSAFAGEQSLVYKSLFVTQKAFAVAQALMNVPSSFSKAYDATVGIPFVGPFLAPAAGAAAAAAQVAQASSIKSVSLTGQAHEGIDDTRKGTWFLDDHERVVDKRTNADLKQYLTRANGRAANDGDGASVRPKVKVNVYVQGNATARVEERQDGETFTADVFVAMVQRGGNEVADVVEGVYGLQRGDR